MHKMLTIFILLAMIQSVFCVGEDPPFVQLGSTTLASCSTLGTGFFCGTVPVPLDHFAGHGNPRSGSKLMLFVMVHLAPGVNLTTEDRDAILMPSGGPGTATHNYAQRYAASYSGLSFFQTHDLVFVDQRGMGYSCPVRCPDSYAGAIMSAFLDSKDRAEDVNLFGDACRLENSNITSLPCEMDAHLMKKFTVSQRRTLLVDYVGTRQAAGDLDQVRDALGYGQVWVYGRSYGTQVAQTWAADYPSYVKGVVIDSPVDQTRDIAAMEGPLMKSRREWVERAMNISGPHSDFGGSTADASQVLDDLLGDLTYLNVSVPGFGGVVTPRTVSRWELEWGLVNWLGSPWQVTDVLHSLAKAKRGDWSSLVRMRWGAWGFDPTSDTSIYPREYVLESMDPVEMYPIVYGLDFSFRYRKKPSNPDSEQRFLQFSSRVFELDCGVGELERPFGSTYLFDSFDPAFNPCDYDVGDDPDVILELLPTPESHVDYPILVVGPSHDPFCSEEDADRLFQMYSLTGPTRRFVLRDGPHVSFAKQLSEGPDVGYDCINSLVDDAISNGTLPTLEYVECELQYPMSGGYAEIPPPDLEFDLDMLPWFWSETEMLPEFRWWSSDSVSCDVGGGTVTRTWTEVAEVLQFVNCTFDIVNPGVRLDGQGEIPYETGIFNFNGSLDNGTHTLCIVDGEEVTC